MSAAKLVPTFDQAEYKAPFPYIGGKSRVAAEVWARFGDVPNYVEPFFGSGAVLFKRPAEHDWAQRVETVNDADGMVCLAPKTRLLAGDLSWVPAGDVAVGTELLAFDESNGPAREGLRAPTRYRHYCMTRVTQVSRVVKRCYRLTFDDGTCVVASEDHQWLSGSHKSGRAGGGRGWRWQSTKGLVCNRATQRSWVLKLCDVVDREETHEAGWLAGFFDGEGSLISAPGWRASLSQKVGPEADRAERLLRERGFDIYRGDIPRAKAHHSDKVVLQVNGGMRETFRLLMQLRPERLIEKFRAICHDMSLYGRCHQAVGLVAKEDIGLQEVVAIETESHTFVAEGLASHNCNFWRALQVHPEEVARNADWPVNENDLHARHAWLKGQRADLTRRLEGDPEFFDAKVAGWWVWATCLWIGTGFDADGPWVVVDGELVNVPRERGVKRQRPELGAAGVGIHRKLPHLGDAGRGECDQWSEHLRTYMLQLADRLRRVRVCCGDWSRVTGPTPTVKNGITGVFLDPPYSQDERDAGCYAVDRPGVAAECLEWCLANGNDPRLRIVLCGYAGEGHEPLEDAGWSVYAWKANGGYSNQQKTGTNDNKHRERIWFSPHCINAEADVPHQPTLQEVAQ